MDGINSLYLILLLVSLGFAAFFCSAETAFIGMQKLRLQHLIEKGDPRAKIVARIMERPEKFLATVLLGNNLVNTAIGALGTMLAISILGTEQQGLSVALATGAVTVAVVVLGEVTPKTLAARHPEPVAFFFVRLWEIVEWVLSRYGESAAIAFSGAEDVKVIDLAASTGVVRHQAILAPLPDPHVDR